MSDVGGLTVLDGGLLRGVNPALPTPSTAVTGAELLSAAESEASAALFGLALPDRLKSAAVSRILIGDVADFSVSVLDPDQASSLLHQYLSAIADELKDDPLVVLVLDGNTLRLFLEDEDDFAMLAENLFTELDVEDKGKISKSQMRNALVHMGVEMGVPSFSEFPPLEEIMKKHVAEGEDELGQAQFAQILQPILQDLADALAIKPVTVIQNIKIINGSQLRKLLADEKQLNGVIETVLQEMHSGENGRSTGTIKHFLERKGGELGLTPSEANEAVTLLYDAVFTDAGNEKGVEELEKGKLGELVKEILEKFAEILENNPIFHELDN